MIWQGQSVVSFVGIRFGSFDVDDLKLNTLGGNNRVFAHKTSSYPHKLREESYKSYVRMEFLLRVETLFYLLSETNIFGDS